MTIEKSKIIIDEEKCAQCLSCQLICSHQYTHAFNPLKARIVITRGYMKGGSWKPNEISFTDECIEGCVLCAKYCLYGAIAPVQEA
ncbi:MAG: hypothetical protein SVM80_10340 [Halobacteriota archaeon]|nr:hypothetical protein [Halobacteriota archaeon]